MKTYFVPNSALSSPPSRQPMPGIYQPPEMLTPSEIEQLRQEQGAQLDLFQKEFPKAKII